MKHWDYRYELTDFKRHPDGHVSYTTRDKGEIPYVPITSRLSSTRVYFRVWSAARTLAEKTGKDVIVEVFGRKIITSTRTPHPAA